MTRRTPLRCVPFVFAFAMPLAAGCGTMMHGTTQPVQIVLTPSGARATIHPTGQTVTTPATVQLSRGQEYTVRFELDGYQTQTLELFQKEVDAVAYGGLLGAAVDRSGGGAYRLVPNPLHADLQPVTAASGAAPRPAPGVAAVPSTGPVPVIFYNTSSSFFTNPISIWIDQQQIGELERYQYVTVPVKPGAHRVKVAHWDALTFEDDYQIEIPRAPVFIEVYSELTSTHARLHENAPRGFSTLFNERPTRVQPALH